MNLSLISEITQTKKGKLNPVCFKYSTVRTIHCTLVSDISLYWVVTNVHSNTQNWNIFSELVWGPWHYFPQLTAHVILREVAVSGFGEASNVKNLESAKKNRKKNCRFIQLINKISRPQKVHVLLTTVGHLKEIILLKLLKHAPFNLNKLQWQRNYDGTNTLFEYEFIHGKDPWVVTFFM